MTRSLQQASRKFPFITPNISCSYVYLEARHTSDYTYYVQLREQSDTPRSLVTHVMPC